MDKFAHEKNRRMEIAKKQGVDPIWVGIRKNDEYIGRETRVNFVRPIKLNSVKTSAASVHEKIATAAERINKDYIQKIINSTNSFPTAFMAVKENRDLVRKLRAAKFKNPVIDKDKNNLDKDFDSLSKSSKKIYAQLLFAHPETRIGIISKNLKGETDVEIISFNKTFIRELRRALNAHDKQQSKT